MTDPRHALLALVPHRHAPVGALGIVVRAEGPDDGACIVLGLEQPGHQDLLIGANRRGLGLQTDEVAVLAGQHVSVGVPPALLPRLPRELDQRLALLRVIDAVDVEQVPHVPWVEPGPLPGLDPGDLRRMPLKPGRHIIAGQAQIRRAGDAVRPSAACGARWDCGIRRQAFVSSKFLHRVSHTM